MRKWEEVVATGLYSGYSPVAPGTVGTLFAIPLFLLVNLILPDDTLWYLLLIGLLFCMGVNVSESFERVYHKKDPAPVVIDEIVGFLVTMMFVKISLTSIALGFILFRFFDIAKIPPGRYFDKKKKSGGFNIMMDDIVAGIYACISLHIILKLINL